MFKAAFCKALPASVVEVPEGFLHDERLIRFQEVYPSPAGAAHNRIKVIGRSKRQKAELKAAAAAELTVAPRRRAAFPVENRRNIAQKLWT